MTRLWIPLLFILAGCAMTADTLPLDLAGDAEVDADGDAEAETETETEAGTGTGTVTGTGTGTETETETATETATARATGTESGFPILTLHSPQRASFPAFVAPIDACHSWRKVRELGTFDPDPCSVVRSLDELTLMEARSYEGSELLLVRNAASGETDITVVSYSGDGVNWYETLTVRSFERASATDDRLLIELDFSGDGNSCTEPEAYSVTERQLVVCDEDVCTRPIPIRRHDITTTFLGEEWERSVDRVTTRFRLRVRLTRDGVHVRRVRGRVPRDFRDVLGRHDLVELAPEV